MRKAVVNRKVVQCRQRKAAQCKAGTAEEESSAKAEDRDRQLKEFTKLRELKELQVRTPRLSCPASFEPALQRGVVCRVCRLRRLQQRWLRRLQRGWLRRPRS